jgi:hypothetical protein
MPHGDTGKFIAGIRHRKYPSEGDLLRITNDMIDRRFRVVVLKGGRMKIRSEQAPRSDWRAGLSMSTWP